MREERVVLSEVHKRIPGECQRSRLVHCREQKTDQSLQGRALRMGPSLWIFSLMLPPGHNQIAHAEVISHPLLELSTGIVREVASQVSHAAWPPVINQLRKRTSIQLVAHPSHVLVGALIVVFS